MGDTSGLNDLKTAWPESQSGLLQAFVELTENAKARPDTKVSLISRTGVSHSFRAALDRSSSNRERPVYFLVDVIVSEADPWFLSVCFYQDEITDPEDLGNPIPQGLFGETGYCFDVDDYEAALLTYLSQRIAEAHNRAMAS